MVEYVLAFSALLVVLSAMAFVVRSARRQVVRSKSLVGSDYP